MDTREVAEQVGTEPKILRRFIRSDACTFQPVGSGGRYEFQPSDIPALIKQFNAWVAGQAPKPPTRRESSPRARRTTNADADRAVWDEEGPVRLPDINDPTVRAEVQRRAREADARLQERLIAAGLHITNGYAGHRPSA